MKKIYHALLVVLFSAILISNSFGQAETPMGKCKGKYLGNVMDGTSNTGADYNFNMYWNQVTAENGCKWGSVEGTQGAYNFGQCDVSYNWAKNNNGFFKYHNLAWGSQTPGYISTASTATITTAVENYIAAVAAHYGGENIDLIDVFNEPVHTALPGNYKAALTAGYQAANPGGTDQYGWIIWVFQLARKAFPNAKLLMNEYSIENDPNNALVTYAAMANSVLNAPNLTDGRKNLIDGLGLQCHAFSINASTGFTATEFQSSLDKLYGLTGLPMHITEMDLDANPTEATQSSQYNALFPVAWAHPHVAGMTLWGYVQGFTWRNGNGTAGPNGTDSGIMYASTYGANPGGQRPALTTIQNYMATQPNVTGCPLPGTYGPGWANQACTTAAPTTTKAITYCVGATAKPLTATAGTGGTLNWYLTPQGAEGGKPLTTAPTPSTTTAGETYYYVSQTIGCESFRDTIIVTVSSSASCSTATCSTVAPTVTTPVTYCQGATAAALKATAGTGGTLNWYGTSSSAGTASATAPTPSTTATGSTTYYVSQTIGCEGPRTGIVVTVDALPTATITPATTTTFCTGGSVVLNANAGTGLTYQWSDGGTAITGATAASYTATTAGSYTVTVKNANNCSATSTGTTVTVNPLPTATITPATTTTFCTGGSVVLNATTGTGLTYQWSDGGTAITGATAASYTATTAGSYTVTVKNANTCSATSTGTIVTVNTLPTATITPAATTTFCTGGSVVLNANAGTGLTYQWSNGGTAITGATAVSYTATTTGSYTVTVKNANNCSATSTGTTVTVNPLPTATITPATTTTFCTGGSVVLNANAGTGLTYQWSAGGTAITGATAASYTATTAGSYTVTVTNTNTCSAASTGTTVTVNPLPTATITPATTTTFCTGGSVVLNATTGTGLSYQWSAGGTAITGATAASYTATTAGSYTVTVTNANKCTAASTGTTVTVNSIPAAPTVTTPVNFCQNTTTTALTATGTSLLWYTLPGTTGSGSPTAPIPSTTTAGASGYYVSQTINGCESQRAAIVVNINATPTAPTTAPVTYCENATPAALTATAGSGGTLNWYGTSSGAGIASATAPTPVTTATGSTTYYVSQTIAGCEGPRATETVTVNALPAAAITPATPTTFCAGGSVVLNATTATGLTYQWNNGGAAISGATGASYTATTSGAYTVTVTNTSNCTTTSTGVAVTVDTPPSTSIAGDVQFITTTTGSLAANAPTTGAGAWSVVSGTGTFTNAALATTTVSGLSLGANVLQWTISNGTCPSSSSTVTINVGISPIVQTVTGLTNVTDNETGVTYSVPDNNGSTYHWTLPPGAIITSANTDSSSITVSFGTTGGNVTVTETNPYGSATSSLPISVGSGPAPQTISGTVYVISGQTGLTYSVPDSSGSTYHWTLPPGAAITSANADSSSITVSFGSTGGNLSVTRTDPYGSATSSLQVSVGNSPTPQTILGPVYVPTGQTGVTYSIPDSSGSTYHWTLPPGATITSANADSSSITVSFGSKGGNVSVTRTDPYGSANSTLPVSIGYSPIIQTITGPDSATANEGGVIYSVPDSSGSTYHWTLPVGATITSANTDSSSVTVSFGTTGGNVSVTQTNPYGTATSTLPVSISSTTTGVIAGTAGDSFEVRPNPFSDYTTIIVHSPATEQITLSVINLQGVTCYSSSQYSTNQEFTLGSELTTDGVYFVQLTFGNEVKVLKLVKVK